jgi:hypothetical protein
MNMPPIVSPQEWDAAREKLLVKEEERTRARDRLAAERGRMPRMLVEKDSRFEGHDGPVSLVDVFAGRRELIVYARAVSEHSSMAGSSQVRFRRLPKGPESLPMTIRCDPVPSAGTPAVLGKGAAPNRVPA